MSLFRDDLAERFGITGRKFDAPTDESVIYADSGPRATVENLDAAHRLGWLQALADDFDAIGDGLYVDKASRQVYERTPGNPLLGGNTDTVSMYFVASDGNTLICLQATHESIDERHARHAREAEQRDVARADAEQARRKRLDSSPQRPVTLADIRGRGELPTLRQAADLIVHEYRGAIGRKNGRLHITVPQLLVQPGTPTARVDQTDAEQRVGDAALVIVACRDLVLAELDRRGGLDPNRLPDAQVAADGGIVP